MGSDPKLFPHLCEDLMVMQRGQTVEKIASKDSVVNPYTRTLMQASSGFQRAE